MNVFIPFIEPYITSYKIQQTIENQHFGKVVSIELHDKKLKHKNNDKNGLKSAKHNYAFLTIELFNTTQGNNMRNNLLYNKTTHLMFEHNQQLVHLHLKPHLSIEDRLERGFELHIPDTSCIKKSVEIVETEKPVPDTFEISITEISNFEEDENEFKQDEPIPEWFDNVLNTSFDFEFGKELPKQLSHIQPSFDLPFMIDFLQYSNHTTRNKISSFYDDDIEKQLLESDYYNFMRDINSEREHFQNYSLLPI